jgi:hypothetical protein
MSATNELASVVMIAIVLTHSPLLGSFQFSQMPPMPKWLAVPHRDGIGLLRLLSPDRLPLEETFYRHNAPAQPIRISERRQ